MFPSSFISCVLQQTYLHEYKLYRDFIYIQHSHTIDMRSRARAECAGGWMFLKTDNRSIILGVHLSCRACVNIVQVNVFFVCVCMTFVIFLNTHTWQSIIFEGENVTPTESKPRSCISNKRPYALWPSLPTHIHKTQPCHHHHHHVLFENIMCGKHKHPFFHCIYMVKTLIWILFVRFVCAFGNSRLYGGEFFLPLTVNHFFWL